MGLYAWWFIEHMSRAAAESRPLRSVDAGRWLSISSLRRVSAAAAQDAGLYARGFLLLLQLFLLFVYLVNWIRTREDVRFVVTMLLWGLLFESLIIVGLGTSAGNVNFGGFKVFVDTSSWTQELGGGRFYGTLGSPINAAAYLELILAPALAVLATNLGRRHKVLAAVGLGLGLVALVGTLSRAAWGATVLSLVVTCLAFGRGGQRRLVPESSCSPVSRPSCSCSSQPSPPG